ncbi:ras guanine nucleotide exchange factor domain-containing protein [Powellomyces hirtus]|nr:ras guanine nucleotide exchange factor domain-containing protein [Powellomyces hirtus]
MATIRSVESKTSLLNDDGQNDYFLRVQLPNDMTTVIQVQSDMTMWEIMCVISSKKQLTPSQHTAKIMFNDGKSEMSDDRRVLNSYIGLERIVLQKRTDMPDSVNLARMRQNRRTSVVLNAPKPSNIRMSSQEFPRTETDEAVLAMRLATAKAEAGMIAKNKKTIKNVAMLFFNKKSSVDGSAELSSMSLQMPAEETPPATPHTAIGKSPVDSMGADSDSRGRFSISSRANDSSLASKSSSYQSLDSDLDTLYDGKGKTPKQSGVPPSVPPVPQGSSRRYSTEPSKDQTRRSLIRSATSNGIMSMNDAERMAQSIHTMGEQVSDNSLEKAHLSASSASVDRTGESNEVLGAASLSTLSRNGSFRVHDAQNREKIRKRTVSSPSTTGSSAYATLRRPVMRSNRQRSDIDVLSPDSDMAPISADSLADMGSPLTPMSSTPGDEKKVLLKVNLPDNQSTTILVHPEITMETLLLHICKKRMLDFEQYTLAVPKEGVTVEVDRPVGFYMQTCDITGVIVVQKEKVYSTMCVSEGGQDVMILQLINGDPQVMAATPAKLIERLSDDAEKDSKFMDTLLLTYRSFLKPLEFFDQLVARFNSELPPDPTPEDVEYFERMKLPTQRRVIVAFKWWVKHHYHDFGVDSSLKADLEDFVDQIMSYNGGEFADDASELYAIIESQAEAYMNMFNNYKAVERRGKTIEGMVMVAEISVEDLSQQLCIHNFKLFRNIHPIEYLNQIWQSSAESSPSMRYFIERFDKESYWCATEVVKEKDLKKRVVLLRKLIATGKMCQELNNFFTMYAFIAGLNMPPIQRLKKTWDALPDKSKKQWAELEKIQDPSRNMKNYRDILSVAVPPIVPFLPLYLKDLTFMNDGNASKIGDERQMINFDKLRMMGNRVKDISALASVEYNFEPLPHIQNFLSKPPVEKVMAKLKEMSIECEKS